MEKMLDAKGLTCPKPVILTKKEMDQSKPGDVILVEVDNEMAVAKTSSIRCGLPLPKKAAGKVKCYRKWRIALLVE